MRTPGQPKALESPGKANDARILAEEIAEGLRDALEQIESVLADLKTRVRKKGPFNLGPDLKRPAEPLSSSSSGPTQPAVRQFRVGCAVIPSQV
jgi:hypothetical protein